MTRSYLQFTAVFLLVAGFILHNDLWLWNDPSRVLGLPVGLLYHVALCLAVSAVLGLLIAANPGSAEDTDEDENP